MYATSIEKMIRAAITALALVFICVSAFEHDAVDQCDWFGSGDGGDGSVRSVYLRCTRGVVQWRYPRGALRILLSLPSTSALDKRDFRTCVKISGPARVFLEASGKLIHLYSPSDGKHELSHRCFRSRRHITALFMEAEDNNSYRNVKIKLQYNLEPKSLKGGTLHIPDDEEECRPCTTEELAKAYCESDLVARGTITAIQQQYIDTEAAELIFRVTKVLHQVQEAEGNESIDVTTSKKNVHVRVPATCDAQHGYGEFVIMAKRRFGDFILVCAPTLEEWAHAVREMNSAPCILNS